MSAKDDRLAAVCGPFLQPGEVVAHVIKALEGPNRWAALGLGAIVALGVSIMVPNLGVATILVLWVVYTRLYARRLIVATDRRLLVLAGKRFAFTPREEIESLDLETRVGPLKGLWLQTTLGGRRLFIVARSAKEVVAADSELDV